MLLFESFTYLLLQAKKRPLRAWMMGISIMTN